MDTFARLESNVRYYSRRWPVVFARAQGTTMYDESGVPYLDFFAGAGSLNYGHNPAPLVEGLIGHLRGGGLVTVLDTASVAKRDLLVALAEVVLQPRGLDYRVQFTGPTGTSAVEAAIRLARKATGRRRVVSVSGGYHGMTVDAIAASDIKEPAGLPTLDGREFVRVPHEADVPAAGAAVAALESAFALGAEPPAALLVEVVQGEGGARPLSGGYLAAADTLCRTHGTVLIVDDVQAGCGRTGTFFSFEPAGIRPGIVCLSKSVSGLGLPMSLVLIDPALDVWAPGEHTGTFRGSEPAFVTARLAIERWWRDDELQRRITRGSRRLVAGLSEVATLVEWIGPPVGRGFLLGLPCGSAARADRLADEAFRRGLVVETCGRKGDVLKLMPPLTVSDDEIGRATQILLDAARAAFAVDARAAAREPDMAWQAGR